VEVTFLMIVNVLDKLTLIVVVQSNGVEGKLADGEEETPADGEEAKGNPVYVEVILFMVVNVVD
jgi:hypothetical protein